MGDQVDPALKQIMDFYAGDLLRLLLQGKQDVCFISQETLDTVLILEYGCDLHIRMPALLLPVRLFWQMEVQLPVFITAPFSRRSDRSDRKMSLV